MKYLWHGLVAIFVGYSIYGNYMAERDKQTGYPYKPIKVIVPYNPGGGTDTFVRIINKAIKDDELMPHAFVVVNKPGGATTIGSSYVKYAKPDGYTMLCLHEALMTTKATGQSPHGPEAFEPIAATGEEGQMILVSKDSPYQTMEALMAAMKENPETVTFGITQNAPPHFSGIKLEELSEGGKFRFVPTGGAANRLSSLLGGHIDAAIFMVSEYVRYRDTGLNALCYLGPERNAAVPDVPTAEELGYPVYGTNLQYWWFPKDTPQPVVDHMAGVLQKAMDSEYARTRMGELKIIPRTIVGKPLHDRIDRKMAGFGTMKVEQRVETPNLTAWTIALVIIFGVVVGIKTIRDKSPPEVITEFRQRHDLAIGLMVMTLIYAVIISFGFVDFRLVTAAYVGIAGAYLTGFDKKRMLVVGEVALIMSLGLYFVFSQIFLIELP